MNPIGAVILLGLLYFVCFGKARPAVLAMVAGVLYLTEGQMIEVGVHLYAVRILGMALFARVLIRHEWSFSRVNSIDKALLLLYCYTSVIFVVRSSTGQAANIAETIDAFCCYFGFRALITSEDDIRWLLRKLIVLLAPYAFLLLIERIQGRSVFVFMGGPSGGWERDGVARCMGSFRYPVSLGAFAATFLALYIALWHYKPLRRQAYWGIGFCLWMVYVSNSGGSFTAAAAVLVAWGCWYIRKHMRAMRWSILGGIALLALVMKAPVWYVITRGPLGGDSWHRAYLMDVATRHLGQWWLFGMPMMETADWFPYTINGGADITNEYLAFGLTAGIGAMVLLVVVLSRTFGQLGRAVSKLERTRMRPKSTTMMIWGLGAMMTAHVANWFGVTYFDQMYVAWFLQLAAVVSLTTEVLRARPSHVAAVVPVATARGRQMPAPVLG
jgi:hypothetical protein